MTTGFALPVIEDSRERLRTRRRPVQPPPWRPPQLADFLPGRRVLAWDATLTNCAWTAFEVDSEGVQVHGRDTIRPRTRETGYLETWAKAAILSMRAAPVITRWHTCGSPPADLVVEAPAVRGSRTESSLIAGMLIWMDRECAVVSATHVSAVLLGDHKVRSDERKKLIRAEVIRLCPEAAGRDWNEHQRDALATGLTHLWDLGRAGAHDAG